MRFASIARLPIGVKLPLLAGALVLVVGAALSTAAYLTVRRITLDEARSRLAPLTSQLAANYHTSLGQLGVRMREVAGRPALTAFLEDSEPRHRVAALQALQNLSPADSLVVASELRDQQGQVLLAAGRGAPLIRGVVQGAWLPTPDESVDSMSFGNFRLINDTLIVIPSIAPVPSRPGAVLVQWRRAVAAPGIQRQVARILGSGARIVFGNADGSLWTDLNRVLGPPSVPSAAVRGLVSYTRPGAEGEVLASAAQLEGTPWIVAVEFPTREVMGPARSFLRTLIGIALLSVALGLLATWRLSRIITSPLEQLTQAADAIAKGDHSRRAGLDRQDELGRLGAAFDLMAEDADRARRRLQENVESRTRELEATLKELEEAQATLVRREKLALLGQLASGIGHELRNPLGIMSNAVYYLDQVQPDAPADVRRYLGMIRDQITHSSKIINDLLDFSRITPAKRAPVPLWQITDAQLERLEPPQGIVIETDIPPTLPLVWVDPVHAGQVVLNLLTNAVQAMGSVGTIRLRGSLAGEGRVVLEVSDSGPGIPPEHVDKIFEPLFTTKSGGIGLGLAVSRSLAQANGGNLGVGSSSGAGATFSFELPAAT